MQLCGPKNLRCPIPMCKWNGIPFAIRLRKSNTLWNGNTDVGSITEKFRPKILADFGIIDNCIEFLPNTTWLQSIKKTVHFQPHHCVGVT